MFDLKASPSYLEAKVLVKRKNCLPLHIEDQRKPVFESVKLSIGYFISRFW